MKVGFNARHLSDPELNGWIRYSICLINELAGAVDVRMVMYGNKPFAERHIKSLSNKCEVRIAPLMPDLAYEQIWLALQPDKISSTYSILHITRPTLVLRLRKCAHHSRRN
jgi:hypothetical protein